MRALVAFQITPDLEPLQSRSAKITDGGEVDTSFLAKSIDCYDASALELAIQLSEESESCRCPFEAEAVTADNHPVESVLQSLYALRFARVTDAYRKDGLPVSASDAARAICAAARTGRADLLFFGRQSSIGGGGELPYLVASMLGFAVYSEVTQAHREGDDLLRIDCLTDGGSAELVVRVPAVLVIGNAEDAYLRYPTLKDKLRSRDKKVVRAPIEDGTQFPEFPLKDGVRQTGIRIVGRKREGKIFRGDAGAAARFLLGAYREKHHGGNENGGRR